MAVAPSSPSSPLPPAFARLAAFPLARWRAIDATRRADDGFDIRMRRGHALHRDALPEYALVEFEHALALRPTDADAASACAALLIELRLPAAALRVLQACEASLARSADGRCNLAFACAVNGQAARAQAHYEAALTLEPRHVRALDGLSRLAAERGEWGRALQLAREAVQVLPERLPAWLHWHDVLLHARRPADARQMLVQARAALGARPEFEAREMLVAALQADWPQARARRRALAGHAALAAVETELLPLLGVGGTPASALDVTEWHVRYAVAAVQEGHAAWAQALQTTLGPLLAEPSPPGAPAARLWSAVLPALDALALDDAALARVHARADVAALDARAVPDPGFSPVRRGDRPRVGWLVPRLDAAQDTWLAGLLAHHDRQRFDLRVYSNTPAGVMRSETAVVALGVPVQEVSHFTDAELLARLRLDGLDLLLDLTHGTRDARPVPIAQRVAAVHARLGTTAPWLAPAPCDYLVTDRFTHAVDAPPGAGARIRLPHSVWPVPAASGRMSTSMADAPLLRVDAPVDHLDAGSFEVWMTLLRQIPHALLVLPACGPGLRFRWQQQARSLDVEPERLRFADAADAPRANARLLLDPLHRSHAQSVAQALADGLPVVTLAGPRTPARGGAAIARAAGWAEGVASSPDDYARRAIALAGSAAHATSARERLAAQRGAAPWWETAARAREMEHAWMHMIGHARLGRAPVGLDVPHGAAPHP